MIAKLQSKTGLLRRSIGIGRIQSKGLTGKLFLDLKFAKRIAVPTHEPEQGPHFKIVDDADDLVPLGTKIGYGFADRHSLDENCNALPKPTEHCFCNNHGKHSFFNENGLKYPFVYAVNNIALFI